MCTVHFIKNEWEIGPKCSYIWTHIVQWSSMISLERLMWKSVQTEWTGDSDWISRNVFLIKFLTIRAWSIASSKSKRLPTCFLTRTSRVCSSVRIIETKTIFIDAKPRIRNSFSISQLSYVLTLRSAYVRYSFCFVVFLHSTIYTLYLCHIFRLTCRLRHCFWGCWLWHAFDSEQTLVSVRGVSTHAFQKIGSNTLPRWNVNATLT